MADSLRVKFSGSYVALITPFDEKGEVCFKTLGQLIDWHVKAGSDGLVVLGTTGESALLSDEEFWRVAEFSMTHAAGRISIILGCGGASTSKTCALAKRLATLRPDGFLSVTPYYVKPSQSGLIDYYTSLADASKVPIVLYNVPGRTGVDLFDETVVKLAEHPNIVGLKDATGDIERGSVLMSKLPHFSFFSGDDETALLYLRAGGSGVISVTANVAPRQMKEVVSRQIALLGDSSEKSSELVEIESLFERLMPLNKALFVEANPIPVKWVLWKMAKIKYGIRSPLTWLDEKFQPEVENAMKLSQIIK